jgi:hypothetical protein
VSHESKCGVRGERPSRTLNPMSFQSMVLTGGGGKTILRDFEGEGGKSVKGQRRRQRGGEEELSMGSCQQDSIYFCAASEWLRRGGGSIAAAGTGDR